MSINVNNSAIWNANAQINAFQGHVMLPGEKKLDLDDFTKFANDVVRTGGDDLVKFGRYSENGEEGKYSYFLRTPSVKSDGWFARDIKGALFRTKETKAVNNNVRLAFVNALIEKYGNVFLQNKACREICDALRPEDFVGSKTAKERLTSEHDFTFSLLDIKGMLKRGEGTGKPLSASRIIAITKAIDAYKTAEAKVKQEKVESEQKVKGVEIQNTQETKKDELIRQFGADLSDLPGLFKKEENKDVLIQKVTEKFQSCVGRLGNELCHLNGSQKQNFASVGGLLMTVWNFLRMGESTDLEGAFKKAFKFRPELKDDPTLKQILDTYKEHMKDMYDKFKEQMGDMFKDEKGDSNPFIRNRIEVQE